MKISFCTTCFNRLYQLRLTFEANLKVISENPSMEWVILNCNSKDGLHELMVEGVPRWPSNLIYARDLSCHPWHLSVAKNTAHQIATGDILFNLDCDNFIGDAPDIVKLHFSRGVTLLHLWSGMFQDGTCGRIAVDKRLFYALRGYDESFYPMAYQDRDLINRAIASGAIVLHRPGPPELAIKNDKTEAIKHCRIKNLSWKNFMTRNKRKSRINLANNQLVANKEDSWWKNSLEIFKGEKESR
jgi:hypothetical protein